jgi:methionyl-tRNA formyltransferase
MLEKTSAPRIIFLGTPDFAVASLKALVEQGFPVVAVVTAPDKPAGRGLKLHMSAVKIYALAQNIPILQPDKLKNPDFLARLSAFKAEIQVVVAFRMLPEKVWNMPPMGTINVHASLLPQYRGAAPINWAIINGETQTGVTTFKLQHAIDTGAILLQEQVPVLPEDNMGSMYEKLKCAGAGLLLQTIAGLNSGTLIPKEQQFTSELNHAPKIFKEDCKINWQQPAAQIHNLIRGLSPYPGAFTFLDNKQLKIFAASIKNDPMPGLPGTYATDGKTFLWFAAADAWLEVLELQPEGKKSMKTVDFLRGWRPASA